jgi:DNA-binding NarL/FixJ family response regulator
MPKCILIVDDNALFRKSLRSFFESQTDFEVCGEAVDGLDAIEKARELNPDLIVLDLSMPRMNGLAAAPKLRALLPEVPIVLFTMHKGAIDPSAAAAAGITTVVGKAEDVMLLVEAVQKLLEPV